MLSYRIVITTKNEERNIGRLITSLLQHGASAEDVLVVDNFSTDQTAAIATSLGAQVELRGPERSEQRNYGAQVAQRDFVLFLDADMQAQAGVLRELDDLVHAGHECIIIPEISVGTGFLSRGKSFERDLIAGDLSYESARLFSTRVFVQCGGFQAGLVGGEDWMLARKAYDVCTPVRSTKAIIHNEGLIGPVDLSRKYFRYGRGYYKIYQASPTRFVEHVNPVRNSLLCKVSTIVRSPVSASALFAYKFVTYAAGLFGFGYEAMRGSPAPRRRR